MAVQVGSLELSTVQQLISDSEFDYQELPDNTLHANELASDLQSILLQMTPITAHTDSITENFLAIASGRSSAYAQSPDKFQSNEISAVIAELTIAMQQSMVELYQRLYATGETIVGPFKDAWAAALTLNKATMNPPTRSFTCHDSPDLALLTQSLRNLEAHGETLRPHMAFLLKIVRSIHVTRISETTTENQDLIIYIENNARHTTRSRAVNIMQSASPTVTVLESIFEADLMNDLVEKITDCIIMLFLNSSLTAIYRAILTNRIAYLLALQNFQVNQDKLRAITPST